MTFPIQAMRHLPGVLGAPDRLDVAYYLKRDGSYHQYGVDFNTDKEFATTRLREHAASLMTQQDHGANDVHWVLLDLPVLE